MNDLALFGDGYGDGGGYGYGYFGGEIDDEGGEPEGCTA